MYFNIPIIKKKSHQFLHQILITTAVFTDHFVNDNFLHRKKLIKKLILKNYLTYLKVRKYPLIEKRSIIYFLYCIQTSSLKPGNLWDKCIQVWHKDMKIPWMYQKYLTTQIRVVNFMILLFYYIRMHLVSKRTHKINTQNTILL